MTTKRNRLVPCPACGEPMPPKYGMHGVSQSRYGNELICSACGVREAMEGFFWQTRTRVVATPKRPASRVHCCAEFNGASYWKDGKMICRYCHKPVLEHDL